MMLQEKYTLLNEVKIPKLGLGTWMLNDEQVEQAIKDGVAMGYRHIDTAQAYMNEKGVGAGVRNCGLNREELFVTTKLAAEIKSYDEAVAAIDNSLATAGLDYFDMMIIHAPKPWNKFHLEEPFFEGNREAWRALEEAYKGGKLKAIGVSNFQVADLDNILESCTVKPMVNQVLAHISNTPFELINYCEDKGILVEAYSPIAHGELMKNKNVQSIAEKYGVSIPQLSVRYCLQLGLLPLPKTANLAHMKNNVDVDFDISVEDMEILKGIQRIDNYGEFSFFPVYGGKMK